jgi:predicted nucleic acid-binding protein
MAKKRKNLIEYSDKIVIADASPLINLHNIDKLGYLKLLFNEVYTTKTVADECGFKMPSWMKIKEPTENMKKLIEGEGIDKGERTAIALVIQLGILQSENIIKSKQSLILDDGNAQRALITKKLGIDCIKLRDIFSLAYDKKLFNREEGINLFRELGKKGRLFTNKDLNFIFNEKIAVEIKKGIEK